MADPEDGDSGSIAVTVGKVAMIDADSSFSSEQEGRYAAYVADNSSGTWWEPAADDKEPAIVMDLSGATEYDVTNIYTVDGVRFLFGGGRGGRRTLPAQNAPRPDLSKTFYKYRIETSLDGKNFKTVLDKTGKVKSQSVVYEDFTPSECRYVKITITDWPKDRGPLKIMECTVFGKATSYLPPKSEIPWHK